MRVDRVRTRAGRASHDSCGSSRTHRIDAATWRSRGGATDRAGGARARCERETRARGASERGRAAVRFRPSDSRAREGRDASRARGSARDRSVPRRGRRIARAVGSASRAREVAFDRRAWGGLSRGRFLRVARAGQRTRARVAFASRFVRSPLEAPAGFAWGLARRSRGARSVIRTCRRWSAVIRGASREASASIGSRVDRRRAPGRTDERVEFFRRRLHSDLFDLFRFNSSSSFEI